MNPGIQLAGLLRRLFGIARIMIGLAAFMFLVAHIPGPWSGKMANLPFLYAVNSVRLADVSLIFKGDGLALHTDRSNPGDLALHEIQGVLVANRASPDTELIAFLEGVLLVPCLLGFAYYFLFFGCLHRVCANIEGGEVFSDRNVRLVRNIGILMVTYAIVTQVMMIITGVVLGLYLNNNVTVPGLDAKLDVLIRLSVGVGTNSPMGNLITGCVVALIGEAFRQGRALKSENELTV